MVTKSKSKELLIITQRRRNQVHDYTNNDNNNNYIGTVDSLSPLPEDILIEILSLLPLRAAITTATLSRRWEHLWTQIPYIHLNLKSISPFGRILRTYAQIPCPISIHTFTMNLKTNFITWDRINLWFHLISRWNNAIQEVKVPYTEKTLQLNSLVTLELDGAYALKLPYSFDYSMNLSNLKKLTLHLSAESYLSFLEFCLSLEDLSLTFSYFSYQFHMLSYLFGDDYILLSCSSLKRLSLSLSSKIDCNVVVDARKLEYLKVDWCYLSKFFFASKPRMLQEVDISGDMLVVADDWTENTLKNDLFKVISKIPRSLILDNLQKGEQMTMLANLAHLKCILTCSQDISNLFNLLKKCPMLEVLIMNFKPNIGSNWPEWFPPKTETPAFILTRLKRVEMNTCFSSLDKDASKLVKYLLSNASVLEQIVLMWPTKHGLIELIEKRRFGLSWNY